MTRVLARLEVRRRAGLAAPLVLVLLTVAAPPAPAGFVTPSTLVAGGEQVNASDRAIAIDAAGRTTVVWHEPAGNDKDRVRARRMSAGGALGPARTLSVSGEDSFEAAVASSAGGRSFVAWRERNTFDDPSSVEGRWIEADGSLGPVLPLLVADVDNDAVDLRVVVSPAGVATVLWKNEAESKLALRRVAANSTLGTPIPNMAGTGAVQDVNAAALPDGTTLAVWRDSHIEGNVVTPAGATGAVDEFSQGIGTRGDPGLALDSDGDGVVAWRMSTTGSNYGVFARRITQTGQPTGTEITVDPVVSRIVGIFVRVAADTDDDFMVAWDRQNGSGDDEAWARRLDQTGTFAGAAQVVSASTKALAPFPALDDRGGGAVAWVARNAMSTTVGTEGRVVDATANAVGPKAALATKAFAVEGVSAPALGVAAFLSHTPTSGSAQNLNLSRYMVPPICSSSQAAVVQGKPIAAPLNCTGPAIEGAKVTTAPKHGTVGAFGAAGPTLAYVPTPGYAGPDSFKYRAVNDGGQSNVATVTIAVGRDTIKPVVNKLKLKVGKKGKNGKRPLRFNLAYSEPATAKVKVKRRQKNGKFKKIGSVEAKTLRRKHSRKIKGKLLERIRDGGSFRAIAVATDAAGNRSARKVLEFQR